MLSVTLIPFTMKTVGPISMKLFSVASLENDLVFTDAVNSFEAILNCHPNLKKTECGQFSFRFYFYYQVSKASVVNRER